MRSWNEKGNDLWESLIPNVFLTDVPPACIFSIGLGLNLKKVEVVYPITVEEILKQGYRVFKNPNIEYENLYNVPIVNGDGLRVDISRKMLIREGEINIL